MSRCEDRRIASARALLAEQRQPLLMTPGDVRGLLARYQRRLAELLEYLDGQATGSQAASGPPAAPKRTG